MHKGLICNRPSDLSLYAVNLLERGYTEDEVAKRFRKDGIEEPIIKAVIRSVIEIKKDALRKNAKWTMLWGALICVIGLVITIGTYYAAMSRSTGGTYYVAWGAIVFGAWRCFKGWSEYIEY